MYNKLLNRFVGVLLFSVVLLIFVGGLVTSTQSGLSVPDWPNSYGYNMFTFPPSMWVGGIFYEHTHRLIASTIGLLTLIYLFLIYKFEKRSWVKKLTLISFFAVCLQGLLGGLTVLFLLPDLISTFHATLAQTFFCLIVTGKIVQSKWWFEVEKLPNKNLELIKKLSKFGVVVFISIYIQLIFGAWMRHTESGLAVPDWPLSYGQVVPTLSQHEIENYNSTLQKLNIRNFADGQIKIEQIIYHMLHRSWAYFVAAVIVLLFLSIRKSKTILQNKIYKLSSILVGFVFVQFTLGVFTVLTQKSILITTSHVAVGAIILGICCNLVVSLFRIKYISEN